MLTLLQGGASYWMAIAVILVLTVMKTDFRRTGAAVVTGGMILWAALLATGCASLKPPERDATGQILSPSAASPEQPAKNDGVAQLIASLLNLAVGNK